LRALSPDAELDPRRERGGSQYRCRDLQEGVPVVAGSRQKDKQPNSQAKQTVAGMSQDYAGPVGQGM